MSKSTIIFIITMGFTLIIHGGLTYLVVKLKNYSLINGFNNRPLEEQEQLIKNGYPQAIGKLLLYTFYILFVSVILGIFQVPYGFEVGLAIFLIVLLGGIIYIQKYDLPSKRKKTTLWTIIFSVITFLFIGLTIFVGFQDNKVEITEDELIISGNYGESWKLAEIEEIALLEALPEVEMRTNGFAAAGRLMGNFRLEEPYGRGKLFVYKNHAPFLFLKNEESYIIINRKDPEETITLYNELSNVVNNSY